MRFGIREVCDCSFDKLSGVGPKHFEIDSAKMSTLESSSSTVYAQGGQGYSRLLAWEGEKALTFTVEDALITLESFQALTGADVAPITGGYKFTTKTTSFAGYYAITAETLFRDEEGNDHRAVLTIPRAKLQSNLSLSMAPTGDPSTFTFTFDAMPSLDDKETLFTMEVYDHPEEILVYNGAGSVTTVSLAGSDPIFVKGASPKLSISTANVITVTAGSDSKTITIPYGANDTGITDLKDWYAKDTAVSNVTLEEGTTVKFYII